MAEYLIGPIPTKKVDGAKFASTAQLMRALLVPSFRSTWSQLMSSNSDGYRCSIRVCLSRAENPWNAMYNRVGGLGDSVGMRAGAGGPADWNNPLQADRYRWDGKYLPGFGHKPGTNPFAWVESISQAQMLEQQELERDKAIHHELMRTGKLLRTEMKSSDVKLTPTTESKRMARCVELEKRLGVDKVVLDPMKLQIDTTAWGVNAAQDKKRANASYDGGVLPRARDKTNAA